MCIRDSYTLIALEERGDGTTAEFHEGGQRIGRLELPLPGRHNLSNVAAALAVCREVGVPFEPLQKAVELLKPPGRRFDCRGVWQQRVIVDDYAHHPSEVEATMQMARLMVTTGRSQLPVSPRRLVAVFQPHRYSRTSQFMDGFAAALAKADLVLLAPLYTAGEAPIEGISSTAMAEAIRAQAPDLSVRVARSMEELADVVATCSRESDLVLAMGAGDVNSLWDRLAVLEEGVGPDALVA